MNITTHEIKILEEVFMHNKELSRDYEKYIVRKMLNCPAERRLIIKHIQEQNG